MSEAQVERLQSLLARVQENREKPRATREAHAEFTRPAMAAPAAVAPAPLAAATAAKPVMPAPVEMTGREAMRPVTGSTDRMERERPSITEERVHLPDRVSVPQRPAANRSMPQPEPRSSREPAVLEAAASAGRRALRDRTATPLEMAVEGELNRPAQPEPIAAPKPARPPTAQTERQMPAAQVGMQAPAESTQPLTIEAEPVAEMGRPIAQVVSKHTLELDTTFGAMLKRSLSLRPH